ncbi:universal stress protein [Halomicrobium mukohataei]|uniref:Universal stress protein n=2 Tax=Haloarculaceae TaxID=1963268 RepID=A0A847UCV9_9EURY|nr:universal stress protein [Halomicrobium mukohataei]
MTCGCVCRSGNTMYDTVLVPTDGSDHAERAGAHAAFLARAFDASIHLLNVVDLQAAAGPMNAGGVDEAYVERLESEGEATIGALEPVVDGLSVETAVVRGRPSEAILDYAAEHDVDLLAMGTHGRTGLERYIAGSVVEHVVRHATVPVLTTRAVETSTVDDGYDEIVIPTDGSEPSTAAVEHGLAIAERADARVHAINVVNVATLASGPDHTAPTELLEELTARGERVTEEIATAAAERGLDATTTVREGFPARDILDYVEANDADLVAMGTAGRSGLNRFLLGSTTERVVRHSPVPVCAVNARDTE